MARYNNLKQDIDQKVFENSRQLITGEILNGVLKEMVDALGKGYQFMGLADPDTNPHTGDAKLFYLAKEVGVYEHFADLEVEPKEIAFFVYDLEWQKIAIPMSVLTDEQIAHLEGSVRFDQSQTLTEPQKTQARQNIGAVSTEQMIAAILVEKARAEAQERELQEAIDREVSRASVAEGDLHNEILAEQTRATSAESELSGRIDAIVQGRDVRDIVPNYQALLDYDTDTLGDNDIIMVLLDNTKSDHTTYYRWHIDTQSWEFIGGLAFTYTKTEIDEKFADLHIVLPVFNEQSSQELLAQVDETIRHAGADAQFKLPIPVEGMSGNVAVTYVKYNPMHTYLGVFADDRSELYHITRTLTSPRTYTCEVITKVFATADALASLINGLYNDDPEEGELGDIIKIHNELENKADATDLQGKQDKSNMQSSLEDSTTQYPSSRAVISYVSPKLAFDRVITNPTRGYFGFQQKQNTGFFKGTVKGENSFAFGELTDTNNQNEVAFGKANVSKTTSSPSNNTLFTIGIGIGSADRKNAVEITQSGNQYVIGVGGFNGKTTTGAKSLQDTIASKADATEVEALKAKVEEIQLYKTPNVTINGTLTIDHGQVSGFSRDNYMALPFLFESHNKRFELSLAFIMGEDINTAQNILGSAYSLALYVQNGKLNVRVSSNGTDWNIISWEWADKTLVANRPYFVKLTFNGIRYAVLFSENGSDYQEIFGLGSNQFPFARLLYLGVGNNFNNPFKGTINLNKCELLFNEEHFWEGMDDAGLASRLSTDLANIDEQGKLRIREIAGENLEVSRHPHIGDIAILLNGERMFLTPLASQEMADNAIKIGVVYDVEEVEDGTIVRVVGDGNTNSKQWSCVADYEIASIPSASGNYAVTLNGVAQGDFTYTRNEGTIKEFCEQLNAWLKEQPSTTKAAKWEAYWDEPKGKGFLQMYKYDEYESSVSIASTGLSKLIGSELSSYTTSSIYNTIGQNIAYVGMCRNRLEDYCKNNTSANCNPTTAMNGTTQLYATFPCSEAYYLGDLGVHLREHYATYGDYLDACMVNLNETRGIIAFHDGKLMTSLLRGKVVKKDGVPTKAYTAAVYADEYDKGVEGFGHGEWWLPSMWELSKLMKDIRVDQTDAINMALGKCRYTKIAPTSYRWSCCRYLTNSAWSSASTGISDSDRFYHSFTVSVVSAFKTIKN